MGVIQLQGVFSDGASGVKWRVGRGPQTTYVAIQSGSQPLGVLEVHHESVGASFRQTAQFGEWVAAGLGDYVYLLAPASGTTLQLKLDFYFGSFYSLDDKLLVCSASEVVCLNLTGKEEWRTGKLGVDGVILHRHDSATVWGSAEQDPPDNWHPFSLDLNTGRRIN